MTGRMYSRVWSQLAALLIFAGFVLTFLPQFILGYLGMPRRYHHYPPEFQVLNVLSTAGASLLALGYLLPFAYLFYSLRWGPAGRAEPVAGDRSGVADAEPTAEAQLRDDAGGHARAVRVLVGGRRPCPLNRPCSNRSSRPPSSSAPPRCWGCGCSSRPRCFCSAASSPRSWRRASSTRTTFEQAAGRLNVLIGGVNTVVLLASSLAMALAVHAAQMGRRQMMLICLGLTALSGAGFLGLKGYEYYTDWRDGLVPRTDRFRPEDVNPFRMTLFMMFYFILTGLHAVHLTIGIGLVSWLCRPDGRGPVGRASARP